TGDLAAVGPDRAVLLAPAHPRLPAAHEGGAEAAGDLSRRGLPGAAAGGVGGRTCGDRAPVPGAGDPGMMLRCLPFPTRRVDHCRYTISTSADTQHRAALPSNCG